MPVRPPFYMKLKASSKWSQWCIIRFSIDSWNAFPTAPNGQSNTHGLAHTISTCHASNLSNTFIGQTKSYSLKHTNRFLLHKSTTCIGEKSAAANFPKRERYEENEAEKKWCKTTTDRNWVATSIMIVCWRALQWSQCVDTDNFTKKKLHWFDNWA